VIPAFAETLLLPFGRGYQTGLLIRQTDPHRSAEHEFLGGFGNQINAQVFSQLVIIYVTGFPQGFFETGRAMTTLVPAFEGRPAQLVGTAAVDRGAIGDLTLLQPRQCGNDLEG